MNPNDPVPSVAIVEIDADTALAVGDSAEFTARVLDADGNIVSDPEITWSSEDSEVASVNDDGRVWALAAGDVVIRATVESASDSADVRVREQDVSEPNDGTEPWPNEPEGFRAMTERPFDVATEDGWTASGDFEIVEATGLPGSTPTTGHIPFPAGFEGGRTSGWTTREGLDSFGHREIYVSFWLKLSDNWQSAGSGVSKVGFVWIHDNPVVFPTNWTYGDDPIKTQIRLQNTPDGARNLDPNVGEVEIRRGAWYRWEILLVANTGDARDGEAHWWIDGEKIGEYTDVIYGDASQSKLWQTVAWRPTWGNRDDVVQEEMATWMDHLYASGSE